MHRKDISSESLFYFYYILILVWHVSEMLSSQSILDNTTISMHLKFSSAVR